MTPDQQREAMAVLAEVWSLSPDVRLGQLFAHLGFLWARLISAGGLDTSTTTSCWPSSTAIGRNCWLGWKVHQTRR
jgi:hypothetical protein